MKTDTRNDVVRCRLAVSLEGGLEPLLEIRAGEKLRMSLEPRVADGDPYDVRLDRWDGSPVGYLDAGLCARFGPVVEKARHAVTATVVALAPNRDGLSEPEVTVEIAGPAEGCGSGPQPEPRPDDAGRVPTRGYPHPYRFEFFNPVQSAVFPLRGGDNNILVCANTSAGKTIAAELVVDDTLARGLRVVYLSPFKALTEERHADWKARYAGRNLVITTGDYELTPGLQERLQAADIVVMTSEMMDSRTRKFESERNEWMRAVGLVVVDEAHILSTPRGDKVETGLMRFTRFCPQARLMLLSATVSNREEIGAWLTALNGKPTDVVHRDWRPVALDLHFVEHRDFRFSNGKPDYHKTEDEKMALALAEVLRKPDEKFLVFVHSKKTGAKLLSRLRDQGVDARYHNGDLDLAERSAAEAGFKDRENGIRVLVSTGTTAWGVNLPARNVVVVGVTRGLNPVDELDIIQMAGRAGRYGIDDEGHVYLLIPEGRRRRWEETFRKPRPVTSVLNDPGRLVNHVLAEIYTGQIGGLEDVYAWYRRSLAHRQAVRPFADPQIRQVFERLVALGMIRLDGDKPAITTLGAVSAAMFFPPEDIRAWWLNFERLFKNGLQDDLTAVAWALGNTPSFAMEYLSQDLSGPADDWAATLAEAGLRLERLNAPAVIAVHACLLRTRAAPGTRSIARQFRSDRQRILNTLRMIDTQHARWNREGFWGELGNRLAPGRKDGKTGPKTPSAGPAGSGSPADPSAVRPGAQRRWIYADRTGRLCVTAEAPSPDGGALISALPLVADPRRIHLTREEIRAGEIVLIGHFDVDAPGPEGPSGGETEAPPPPRPDDTEQKTTHSEDTDDEPWMDDSPSWSDHGRFESEDDAYRDRYGEAGWEDSEGNFFPESWSPE
jgi:superfamily II DNA/RNA helicase